MPLFFLPASEQGDEKGKVARREQQAQRSDGRRLGPADGLGDDGQDDVEDRDAHAAQLRLLEERRAEQRHGPQRQTGQDKVEDEDAGARVWEHPLPQDQGRDDPGGEV